MTEEVVSQPVRLGMQEQVRAMLLNRRDQSRLERLALRAAKQSKPDPNLAPVLFFNASTRLVGLSQNAAFAFLASLGLQQAGVPVVHFGCRAGMSRCVLGTVRRKPEEPPPCRKCIAQSVRLYSHAPAVWFEFEPDPGLDKALRDLDVAGLSQFSYPLNGKLMPLGDLVLSSIRWALRRFDLEDDESTRFFLRAYILSAYRLAQEYTTLIDRLEPGTLVIFNGVLYPEATACWVGKQMGQRVVTFEVAYQPFSVFFSDGLATRYPINIPGDFTLSPAQDAQLDRWLEKRFSGNFTMAGIQFWPEIHGLDGKLAEKMGQFRQVVPIFTNVIYDTSQVDTNRAFTNMFDWLDYLLPVLRGNPDTLFVIRAHPDEMRPGKESRQNVQMWVEASGAGELPNVFFIPSRDFVSSYELVSRSKFVLAYNSSIGLEATLLGTPVLAAAEARYTQYPIVYLPGTAAAYGQQVKSLLEAEEVAVPEEFATNARRFLYYQLFRASLPYGEFLESAARPGFVHLRSFPLEFLHPNQCQTNQVILEGILNGKPFLLPEN
jgi:hypothetical protein